MPIFDKDKSKIKMVVLRSGKHKPITWHSILDKDYQKSEIICQRMLIRLNNYLKKNPEIISTINKIHFYERGHKIGEATL